MSRYTDWPPEVWEAITIERNKRIEANGFAYNEEWHGQCEDGSIIMTVADVPDPDAPRGWLDAWTEELKNGKT